MSNEKEKIDSSEIYSHFYTHLTHEDNSRILFSAPFGSGKSTFLQDFFSAKTSEFELLKLYPVHYSIASNEDIFELIKFDILLSLLQNLNLELQKEEFSLLLSSQVLLLQKIQKPNATGIINTVITLCGMIGQGEKAGILLNPLKSVLKDVKEFQEKMESDEGKIIDEYLDSIKTKPGSNKEFDVISNLITTLIKRVKIQDGDANKTTVLVIDDLDRLDPEHVFRLFNVFSAHHDHITNSNKFGFDKIIFVCDISNVRNIFHGKYGMNVDFTGYIDKFYTNEIYHFDNVDLIKKHLRKLILSIPFSRSGALANYDKRYIECREFSTNDRLYGFFEWISFSLLEAGLLNLRTLISLNQFTLPMYQINSVLDNRRTSAFEYPILIVFHLLKQFWGTTEIVKEKLNRLSSQSEANTHPDYLDKYMESDTIQRNFMNYLLPFLIPAEHGFSSENRDRNESYNCTLPNGIVLSYGFEDNGNFSFCSPYITTMENAKGKLNLYKQLFEIYELGLKKKVIR